jgi:hypothetical protein
MKKPIAILLLFIVNICYSQSAKESIIGEWIATDLYGSESEIIFSNDNYISMSINGEFIDGKNYVIRGGKNDGQKMFVKYEIDDSDLPIKIDIIVIKPENDKNVEKGRILGILDFSNKTETRMNLNFNGTRESEFNDSNINSTIYLKRK